MLLLSQSCQRRRGTRFPTGGSIQQKVLTTTENCSLWNQQEFKKCLTREMQCRWLFHIQAPAWPTELLAVPQFSIKLSFLAEKILPIFKVKEPLQIKCSVWGHVIWILAKDETHLNQTIHNLNEQFWHLNLTESKFI